VVVAECCSIFCVALTFFGLERWESAWRDGRPWLRWALLIGGALMGAVLLRPDEGLLAAAVVPAILWVGLRTGRGLKVGVEPALVASLVVLLPLVLWGVRNWRVFHVVQPLSPKYANDPGEEVPYGFMRWYRTWAIGFPATVNVYWRYDGDTISISDLPARAFDSEEQRKETAAIVARYNQEQASTPEVDAEFGRLAAERIRANPLRYYLELPVARVLDMWFRPRIEYMKIPLDWWRFGAHPWKSLRAYSLGALNVAYLGLACVGFWRWRRSVLAWSIVGFVAMRCALLLTIDNSEPRYTIVCYPVVILLAALAFSRLHAISER